MAFKNQPAQKGFTIVELMISLSVFAVAIVLVTMGVLVVSRQYQQGATRTKLESANREIHQTIIQAVQFAGANPDTTTSDDGKWTAFCVGTQRFVYGTTLTGYTDVNYTTLNSGLYVDTVENSAACLKPEANGRLVSGLPDNRPITHRDNLLPKDAKVAQFEYANGLFTTKFVSSDPDLLNFDSTTIPVKDLNCKAGIAGKEFCAVVQLTSSAIKRVN